MLIAVVTPLFPTASEPYRGWPIFKTVERLLNHADVRVICPNAAYPVAREKHSSARFDVGLPDPETAVRAVYFEYPAIPLATRPWNAGVCARHLYPHLARLRPDLVLNYWLHPEGTAALRVARSLGIPAILAARGSDLSRIPDRLTGRAISKTLRGADFVLTVSREMREHAIRLGVSPEKSAAILNGCDTAIFHYRDRDEARHELKLPGDSRIVLYVGRFAWAKGLIELLHAFAPLAASSPNYRLACAGSGPLRGEMERVARSLGIHDRLLLPGDQNRRQVAAWMAASDVFCLPSYSEGCPNVVIEAVNSGCPVVASNVGGTSEVVNSDCSILVPPADTISLAAALRDAFSRNWDRHKIASMYLRSWETVARETYEKCEQVLKPVTKIKPRAFRSRALRITLVTSYFPTSKDTYKGHSAFRTFQHLCNLADVKAIVPLPAYPSARALFQKTERLDPDYRPAGIETTYFRYPAIRLLTRPVTGFYCLRRLLPLLRATCPDVILNYWLYPDGFAAVGAGRILGIPAIVGPIGSDLCRITDPFTLHNVKRTLARASGVITVSEDLRKRAIAMGARPEDVTTVLNGCDGSIFYPGNREDARREAGFSESGRLVLFVGALLKTKGLAELLEAYVGLLRTEPDVWLAVIGDGDYRPAFERAAAAGGVRERILMLGRLPSERVGTWMRAADVFCLPSYSEGCPNVVLESLSCGCPIVATSVGGIPEICDDRSSLLVPARDAKSLCVALETSLAKPWDRNSIGYSFHRSWEKVARETYEVCRSVLESAHRRKC
jgi:glycosyltransferase involved in cell wall biosynthesis